MSRKYRNFMSMRWTRRKFIATAAVLVNGCDSNSPIFTTTSEVDPSGLPEQLAINKTWTKICDQAWAGQEFWSNRLADWHVHQGRLSTRNETSSMRKRTVSLLSVAVAEVSGSFSLSVLTAPHTFSNDNDAYSGFLIGAGSNVDYRAAALIHNRHGIDGGLIIGVDNAGRPFIHDNDVANQRLTQGPAIGALTDSEATNGLRLQLDASANDDDSCSLNVFVTNDDNEILSSTTSTINRDRLLGHMALVANPGGSETGHWFNELKGSGDMLAVYPEREFGPILFASYTISRKVLTVNVQLPPLCLDAWNELRIEAQTIESTWVTLAVGTIDPLSWTSRIQLNTESLTDYEAIRIAVDESVGPEIVLHTFELSVPASEPKNEPSVIGLLSCRPSIILDHTEGWIQSHNQRPFTWNGSRLGFPHAELVDNLEKQQPDLLAFVGDQIYEFDPNGIVDKSSTSAQIEDYLWKWFQFGWSVRHLLRKTPAFMLPDDHDVFQANIWGASGRPAVNEVDGGFVYSAEFVNVVQRTQVGSLPDGFDDSVVEQGIGVYYTDIVYRNLGIAILEDRKFKSGPNDPEPLSLLGDRQELFLQQWARDWQDQALKFAVSQSPFAQASTHQSTDLNRVQFDPDANSWPKSGRDRAVELLRRVRAPHLAGDQHLGVSLQHGLADYQDAIHSLAGPSMLNVFPRIWDPTNEGPGPGDRSSDYKGNWFDGNGNKITVVGAMNPEIYYSPGEPGQRVAKENLGIGYAVVRIDPNLQTFQFEVWPADVSPTELDAAPHPDWPITIKHSDNDGRQPAGVAKIFNSPSDQLLVEVTLESSGELETAMRYTGTDIDVPLYDAEALYTLRVSDPDGNVEQSFIGVSMDSQIDLRS